jgi:signal transduction histidine kinase
VTLYNDAAVSLWGEEPDLGPDSPAPAHRMLRPHGAPLPNDRAPLAAAFPPGASRTGVEAIIERPDGERRSVLVYPHRTFDGAGRIDGGINILLDITERKRVEEALRWSEAFARGVIAATPDCVKILALDGQFVWVSDQGLRLLEVESFEILRGTSWLDLWLDERDRTAALEAVEAALEGRVGRFEGACPTGLGNPRFWDVAVSAIPGPDGRPDRLLVVSRDITARKATEEALRAADRRKDEFLATLAHELRNPLAPIRNGLEIMRLSECDGERVARTRQMMARPVSQMVRLIDDLLDVSRITRGKIELQRAPADLGTVLESAIETSGPSIREHCHQLEVVVPPDPIPVFADLTRLAQVFANLLNNAAKYTPAGGLIRLVVERRGDEASVTVRDNGIGIPGDMLGRVFERFTQIDRSLERVQGGLGIGLSIARRLVEMHGGAVEARSDGPGRGSEFVVRVPVMTAAPEELPAVR